MKKEKQMRRVQNVMTGYTVMPRNYAISNYGQYYEYELGKGRNVLTVEAYQSRSEAIERKKALTEDYPELPKSEFQIVPVKFVLKSRRVHD